MINKYCQCRYIVKFKAPVTPSRVSNAMARSCLVFRSAMRSQENPDIFREKGSDSDQGVATELA